MNQREVDGRHRNPRNVVFRTLSLGAALSTVSGAAWLGLFIPDIDLMLLPILHHRSIITHSVILVIFARRWLSDSVYVGLLLGISIHLWADSMGASVGFAQVYLPVVKEGLGAEASWIWLLGNALVGFLVTVSYNKKFAWLIVPLFVLLALTYAVFNEGAGFFTYVFAVVGCVMYFKNYFGKNNRDGRRLD